MIKYCKKKLCFWFLWDYVIFSDFILWKIVYFDRFGVINIDFFLVIDFVKNKL